MKRSGGRLAGTAGALALALAIMPGAAPAQSTSDLRLPGATVPPPNPRAAGPVDPDNPVVRSSQPARATPAPTPTPTPTPAATAPASQPRVAATPASRAPAAARPSASPTSRATTPAALPSQAAPTAMPGTSVLPDFTPAQSPSPSLPAPVPLPSASALVSEDSDGVLPDWWPIAAGSAAALLSLTGAALLWRRRRRRAHPEVVAFEAPEPVNAAPQPAADAKPQPTAARIPEPDFSASQAASPPSPAAPAVAGSDESLSITLEANRLVASLMATTLNYRLTVTNRSREPLSALAIEGDMVSAHASLPPEQQIAASENRLELRHALVELAPGESAEFTGDMRLPLTMITPIRAGDAAFFVPLARLRIEAASPARGNFVQVQTFVIGENGEGAGAGLRPFRLDLGPRTYARIGQRAVN